MGVASGCGEQEVGVASESGWNLWVWLMGMVVRRYSCICSFLQQHPYFLFIFFVLVIIIMYNHLISVCQPVTLQIASRLLSYKRLLTAQIK